MGFKFTSPLDINWSATDQKVKGKKNVNRILYLMGHLEILVTRTVLNLSTSLDFIMKLFLGQISTSISCSDRTNIFTSAQWLQLYYMAHIVSPIVGDTTEKRRTDCQCSQLLHLVSAQV